MGLLSMKGEKMMKKLTFGSRVRKRLSDITNLSSQSKSPLKDQENVPPIIHDSSTKNYVQQLGKENAMMMKLIQEKDKIIELNGLELQKLRANLQKTQMQNWYLAQTNTQMLADLNMGKDKLKALQHDIACKDALYKATLLDFQEKAKKKCKEHVIQKEDIKPEVASVVQPKQANDTINNKVSKTKRGQATRSQSLGAVCSELAVDEEITENKRRCLRRQSVRSNPLETQSDAFEINVNTPLTQSLEKPVHESNSVSKDGIAPLSQSSTQLLPQRLSIGRPMRKAAEKIQSYKEPPRNKKMRRPE